MEICIAFAGEINSKTVVITVNVDEYSQKLKLPTDEFQFDEALCAIRSLVQLTTYYPEMLSPYVNPGTAWCAKEQEEDCEYEVLSGIVRCGYRTAELSITHADAIAIAFREYIRDMSIREARMSGGSW